MPSGMLAAAARKVIPIMESGMKRLKPIGVKNNCKQKQ